MTMEWECREIKMSEKILRIFELCKQLAELLGDEKAIADIKRLYDKHPDMFNNVEEVARLIKEVAKDPEIITNAKAENAILAAKRLIEPNKMGDIVIQNSKGINIVIHANKKREKEFDRLKDSLVATPTPTTHRQMPTGELTIQKELSGANALSMNQNPLPNDSRVLESEVAKSLNFDATAHIEASTIANFDNKSIAQSKQQSQGKKPKSKSKSKQNDFENQM